MYKIMLSPSCVSVSIFLVLPSMGSFIKYVHKIFWKTNISNPLISARTSAYQRVRNFSFSKHFAHVLNGWLLWCRIVENIEINETIDAKPRVKYRNITLFAGAEILWKGTVSVQFRAICPKLCGNCAFPQNFNPRKLGEILVFYVVWVNLPTRVSLWVWIMTSIFCQLKH